MRAVRLADPGGLALDVERGQALARGDQRVRQGVVAVHLRRRVRTAGRSGRPVDLSEEVPAAVEPRGAHLLGQGDARQLQPDARLVVDPERVVGAPERAAPLADHALQPLVERIAQDQVRRQVAGLPLVEPADDRPGARLHARWPASARRGPPRRRCCPSARSSRRRRGRSTRGAGPGPGRTCRRGARGGAAARRPACPGRSWRSTRTARDTPAAPRASCRRCRGGSARPRARGRSPPGRPASTRSRGRRGPRGRPISGRRPPSSPGATRRVSRTGGSSGQMSFPAWTCHHPLEVRDMAPSRRGPGPASRSWPIRRLDRATVRHAGRISTVGTSVPPRMA